MEFRSLFMTVIVGELAFKMRKANGSNELKPAAQTSSAFRVILS
jgi:hypothetical protein